MKEGYEWIRRGSSSRLENDVLICCKSSSALLSPSLKSDGEMIVSPPSNVFKKGEQKWRNAIVVQFVGRIPNFSLFQ